MTIEQALRIARDIATGLEAAHDNGVIHRDLKPANVMIDGRGRARLTDFGLAGLAEGFEGAEVRAGTPAYMAPEQLSGKGVSMKSDLYSLGVVLYELLTGERPFPGDSVSSIIYRIVNEEPQDPAVFRDRVPEHLAEFLIRALAKEPDERYADGNRFAAELRRDHGVQAETDACDLAEPGVVAALFERTASREREIRVLVNNAGITKHAANHADLDALGAEDFLSLYAVNVVGPYLA